MCDLFTHILQGCITDTGALLWLPQCQWSNPELYGKIILYLSTTKHNKRRVVCIILGMFSLCDKLIVCYSVQQWSTQRTAVPWWNDSCDIQRYSAVKLSHIRSIADECFSTLSMCHPFYGRFFSYIKQIHMYCCNIILHLADPFEAFVVHQSNVVEYLWSYIKLYGVHPLLLKRLDTCTDFVCQSNQLLSFGLGHGGVALLWPGFAIGWKQNQVIRQPHLHHAAHFLKYNHGLHSLRYMICVLLAVYFVDHCKKCFSIFND